MGAENDGQPIGAGKGDDPGGNAGQQGITLTQAQLDKRIQSEVDRRVQEAVAGRDEKLAERDQKISDLEEQANDSGKSQAELIETQKDRIRELQADLKEAKKEATTVKDTMGGFLENQLKALGEDATAKFNDICPEGIGTEEKISLLGKLVVKDFFVKPAPEGEGDETPPGDTTQVPRRAEASGGGSLIPGKEGLDRAQARRASEGGEEGAPDPWKKSQD